MEESEFNAYEEDPKEAPITLVDLLKEYESYNNNYGFYSCEINKYKKYIKTCEKQDKYTEEYDVIFITKTTSQKIRAQENAKNSFLKIIDYLVIGCPEVYKFDEDGKEEPIIKLLKEYKNHSISFGYYSCEVNGYVLSTSKILRSEKDDKYYENLILKQDRANKSEEEVFEKIIDLLILKKVS